MGLTHSHRRLSLLSYLLPSSVSIYKWTCPLLTLNLKCSLPTCYEGEYLAISASGAYAAILTSHDIHICLATEGHPCVPHTTLYPTKKIKWCIYALFIKEQDLINMHCLVDIHTWPANLAIYEVSSMATEHVQICCLEETLGTNVTPLTFIYIGKLCEG